MIKPHILNKKTVSLVFSLCLLGSGTFLSSPAHATSTAYSTATIDWTSLKITLGSGITGLSWGNLGSWSEAWASHNGVLKDNHAEGSNDWGNTFAEAIFSSPNGSAYGKAYTTANELYAETSAESNAGGLFDGSAHGWGENRTGYFTAWGTGEITFSVDYSLFTELHETLPRPNDLAVSYTVAGLELQNLTIGTNNNLHDSIWYPNWNPPLNGTLNKSGTLSVTLLFNDGELGRLLASVGNGSGAGTVPVPEPATLFLLGSGIAGLVGLGRKKIGRQEQEMLQER